MKCSLLSVIVFATLTLTLQNHNFHPLSDEFINSVNNKKTTWKAGRNFDSNTSLFQLKNLLGVLPRNGNVQTLPFKTHQIDLQAVPLKFDAREAWPECASIIGNIRDQGACGSCWAFGAAEAMSDRICIHSNATAKISISAEDLLECCFSCGNGCEGGYPEFAWLAWTIPGIVTGGSYGSTNGCKAYSVPPCEHYIEGDLPSCGAIQPTPQCKYECDEESSLVYDEDLRRGSGYAVFANMLQIQTEIMTNGPVEADFSVYEDFFSYKNGVYQQVLGELTGEHAIKILGWGEDGEGTPYWLVANSWNENWGDNGYFKILRGSNECGIEGSVLAGMPEL